MKKIRERERDRKNEMRKRETHVQEIVVQTENTARVGQAAVLCFIFTILIQSKGLEGAEFLSGFQLFLQNSIQNCY